ncbi:helix-turn-helix transcriptional regulator [Streptomyces sp. SID3343]|uniref:helix-turn-helix transcriptional regulator n=1 Tax=Streptomyces sp. SID3343 TaxID=2690260 RepID=UPI00136CF930|nr:helix-turn-helix transcriptional regulator [Streptomyces sp. SID3343]MYW04326.1 helix-turn-helix domain-containing protein [Streptomyces sp. SID3343]
MTVRPGLDVATTTATGTGRESKADTAIDAVGPSPCSAEPSAADRAPEYVLPARDASRAELGAFLRSRRERITPEQVGLPTGRRRRTPGLRREELAQLAGVGVTWYTWLEQGRPINVSSQVIGGIARTLRLDPAEIDHVKRLACVPNQATPRADDVVEDDVKAVLDDFATMPAVILSGRYDVLAFNALYARVFPALVAEPCSRRNLIWELFTRPACCNPFHEWKEETRGVVGTLRATYARNVGDPVWGAFIDELVEASPEFATAWAAHPISLSRPRVKVFRHADVGLLHVRTMPADLAAAPGQRMSVYIPQNDASRQRLSRLGAPDFVGSPIHDHSTP